VVKIEYVYASLILHHAKKPITEENIKRILDAAGVKVDEIRIKALVAALKEVNIDDAISAASQVTPAISAPAAPTAAPPAEAEKREEEKKKEEEEKKEEEVAEGLAALFGPT